ncbi:MAG: efflux RND transporter periplasmic adaptor subunit [Ramlibacter sp.]
MIVGGGYLLERRRAAAAEAAAPAPEQLPVGVFRPTKAQWQSLQIMPVQATDFRSEQITDGAIASNDNTTVSVFSPYSGRVAQVVAKVGDVLRKGDALMTIEATEFVQGQNDLIAASAQVNTVTAALHQAQKNEERQHQLYLGKAGALKDWQQSQSDLAAAQSAARTAEIALAAVQNKLRILGKTDREISSLEREPNAQRMQAQAVVTAPISGTVLQRQVGLGQFIQSATGGAANPVFSIADLSTVWLVANLREAEVDTVRVGQQVEVRVIAYPERIFKARISFISPTVDPNTRRVPVRAEIDNRDGALKPMMVASFTIVTGASSKVIAVPQGAVVYDGSVARVFVARDDGTLQARQVQLGRQNADRLEVISGLVAGEKVVTSGSLFIDRAAKGTQS